MTPRDEDEAWREIVDNYGDAPAFEDEAPPPAAPETPPPAPFTGSTAGPTVGSAHGSADEPDPWENEGRFVPPVPPPVPRAEPRRQLAWFGVFVAPAIVLFSVVMNWYLPGFVSLLLVLWFVGGFVYLVSTMPNGPRDPGDDGARI
ncbi:hypothetical protein [Nocardioides donggukensis]|uniref:Uncharacterized protein n=1 Tax=Nocardioides donggukensis TaxID=2774019 RepID=A0A927K390_9ACTN|nr:hypothetical protein [Nocardioides donggukensis]MBD8869167.1 hypothetical protein [Nocardioides donggukensis]